MTPQISVYLEDPNYTYQDFAKRGSENTPRTFRKQNIIGWSVSQNGRQFFFLLQIHWNYNIFYFYRKLIEYKFLKKLLHHSVLWQTYKNTFYFLVSFVSFAQKFASFMMEL